MSSFYERMQQTAARLLKQYGAPITITRTVKVIDPITGVQTGAADTTYTPNGILRSYDDSLIDGTRILEGDRELVVEAGEGYVPTMRDRPTVDSQLLRIINIMEKRPATTPLVYFLQVRK